MEKQTKITKTCEKKSIVWLSSSWLKCKIIDTPFLMLDNNVAYHDVRSSLPPNNIDASGDKNNISWTKTTNSNQRHALSLSGINARWLFLLMDGASEWTFGEQTIAPNFRKNDKPTNLIIVVMKVWWWENGNENAGLRETAPIFRGIPWAHSAWPLWGVVDASEALLRMRPSLGSPSFTLSIMRMHHKRELVFCRSLCWARPLRSKSILTCIHMG